MKNIRKPYQYKDHNKKKEFTINIVFSSITLIVYITYRTKLKLPLSIYESFLLPQDTKLLLEIQPFYRDV